MHDRLHHLMAATPLNRRLAAASVLAALMSFQPLGAAADPQALLAASDAIRNPQQPFRVTVTITEFDRGQQVDTSTLQSFARTLETNGQFLTLLRFVQPARDAGKLMLKSGADLWFYDPSTKASVRISPQQRLMGQASNGDVVTVNFARDYKAELIAEESTTDGERKPRKAIKLLLTAATDGAAYGSVELWVDADSSAPIKARFLSESGRLLKTAFYRRFQRQLGAERPTETVIIDGLTPSAVTIVRFSDYVSRNLPANWFQRDHLPRFQPD